MGYNIEVSFDILKNSSVTELQNMVRNFAEECGCDTFYEDYEYDHFAQFKRNHCVMSVDFSQKNITNFLQFLKFVRNNEGLFLELIYDENDYFILYAYIYI